MKVIDFEPSTWILVQDGDRFLIDVNCSHSAVSYSFLMSLSEQEVFMYKSKGHEWMTSLACNIQDSGPGVRGSTSPFCDRNITGIYSKQVNEAISIWLQSEGRDL